jgi:hypothetical protein
MPVLLVATYRDTEVGPDHALVRTINQLLRRHLVTRITLHRRHAASAPGLLRVHQDG